jgi:hypothetical protein
MHVTACKRHVLHCSRVASACGKSLNTLSVVADSRDLADCRWILPGLSMRCKMHVLMDMMIDNASGHGGRARCHHVPSVLCSVRSVALSPMHLTMLQHRDRCVQHLSTVLQALHGCSRPPGYKYHLHSSQPRPTATAKGPALYATHPVRQTAVGWSSLLSAIACFGHCAGSEPWESGTLGRT